MLGGPILPLNGSMVEHDVNPKRRVGQNVFETEKAVAETSKLICRAALPVPSERCPSKRTPNVSGFLVLSRGAPLTTKKKGIACKKDAAMGFVFHSNITPNKRPRTGNGGTFEVDNTQPLDKGCFNKWGSMRPPHS